MQQRLEFLVEKEKSEGLSAGEKEELDHYIVLERLVRLAKTRAQLYLFNKKATNASITIW